MKRSGLLIAALVLVVGGIILACLMAKAPEKMATQVERVEMDALQTAPSATPVASATPPATAATPSSGDAAVSVSETPAAVSSAAGSVGGPIAPAVAAEFSSAFNDAIASFPTKASLRAKTAEQVHFTPAELIQAASNIGRIAQLVKDHPELSAKGLDFYKQCAEMQTAPDSVRSSCYVDFKKLQNKSKLGGVTPKVPERIAAMAKDIMS